VVGIPGEAKGFTLVQYVQTGSGVYQVTYSNVKDAVSPRVKRPWSEADHSPPSPAENKSERNYISTTSYALIMYIGDFTFSRESKNYSLLKTLRV
jgi:hypothetical protein